MYHQTELNIAKMSWLTMNMAPLVIFQMAIDRPQTKWKVSSKSIEEFMDFPATE
jgi:hypothetical protein